MKEKKKYVVRIIIRTTSTKFFKVSWATIHFLFSR